MSWRKTASVIDFLKTALRPLVKNWYELTNHEAVASPALLVYPDRVCENIRRMIALAGGVERLRPHMKTHKLAPIIALQRAAGITKFKCATIAEAEVTAGAGAAEVLLSYPLVGPNLGRWLQLIQKFPATQFAAVVDDAATTRALAAAASAAQQVLAVLIDLNCGMGRTGIKPGPEALALAQLIASLPALRFVGLHAYDGHIHDRDLAVRTQRVAAAYAPVNEFRQTLIAHGFTVPRIIASGTPTFPIHARRGEVECSPGTCIFWDAGYAQLCPDLDFLQAALVLTRVISKPQANYLTLDLGHKAIASENPHPRVIFLNLPDATAVLHSEEHLVVATAHAADFAVGDCLYGIPWHICPTVALYAQAVTVTAGVAGECWPITGRARQITI